MNVYGGHLYPNSLQFSSKFHHILADGTGVFFVLCWYILFILSFGCVTREMKKCQCHLIYDKANGNVAM